MCFPKYVKGELITETVCHGCSAECLIEREVELQCDGNKTKIVKYQEAQKCWCVKLGVCEFGSQVSNEIGSEKTVHEL
jgi:hypothetical protein